MTGTVLTENAGEGVRRITLNRPARLNAITPELLEDLIAALDAANADPTIGAILLAGAGRAFCAGDDLKEFASQVGPEPATRAYVERIQDVTRAILHGRVPVIGAIHGWAVGGGLEWMINCDFAVNCVTLNALFDDSDFNTVVSVFKQANTSCILLNCSRCSNSLIRS